MTLSLPWLSQLFFIVIRLSIVLLLTPIQAIRQLPIHARLILVFAFSLLLNNFMPLHKTVPNDAALLLSGLAEFANGLILATSIYATFAIFQIAGQLIDNEIGLNASAVFNPSDHHQESITSQFLSLLAVLFFFSLDGHYWLFKGLLYSFIIMPPGTLNLFAGFSPIIKQFAFMFSMAFLIASPIILALLAVDLCGALITRNMPQMSTYFLTLPIKILLGLFLLFLLLNYFNPLSNQIFQHCFQTWQEIMS